ncbi:S-adenosylmethionine:tRNA ribosyltransferase-isomerase [Bacteroidia bacterium]|nr:S-adenosylmethionine:tRNA ribosyltransferase-isomerase [Bacteroidia bacterium]
MGEKVNLKIMYQTKNIRIEEFNYDLPDDRIAKFPLKERDKSRLLVWKNGRITESQFQNLNTFIPENALLIFNNTKVIQARMVFHKETGAQIEIFCLEPVEPSDYAETFIQTKSCTWLCLIGNSKRWKTGKLTSTINGVTCTVEKIKSFEETHCIRFEWDDTHLCFADILEQYGELPIPPYLNRKTEESDKLTYQTIYSKISGSVAAPTAGLHFTESVFESLKEKNIDFEELTLHVGSGTFKPVKSETIAEHTMHSECISVKKSTIEKLLKNERQIFAVGTTSVRTLESLYFIGTILETNPDADIEDLFVDQWLPYELISGFPPVSVNRSLNNILHFMDKKQLKTLTTRTQIMIAPEYDFRIVKGMITNFHQPKSTLLLLVSAFVKGEWQTIYNYAKENDFRFLSYGDSSLLIRD